MATCANTRAAWLCDDAQGAHASSASRAASASPPRIAAEVATTIHDAATAGFVDAYFLSSGSAIVLDTARFASAASAKNTSAWYRTPGRLCVAIADGAKATSAEKKREGSGSGSGGDAERLVGDAGGSGARSRGSAGETAQSTRHARILRRCVADPRRYVPAARSPSPPASASSATAASVAENAAQRDAYASRAAGLTASRGGSATARRCARQSAETRAGTAGGDARPNRAKAEASEAASEAVLEASEDAFAL